MRAIDAPGADPPQDLRVLREHVASVYFNHHPTLLARCVFICVIGAFIYFYLDQPLALPYVLAHLLLHVHLLFAPQWSDAEPAANSPCWVRRITRSVTALGVLDGLAPWLFVPPQNWPATAVLMVVMLGNGARAVQSLRALKSALLGYMLPATLGLITALAAQGDGLHLFLAVFAAVNLAQLLRVGLKERGQLTEALVLRFEKEALVKQLTRQIEVTERASQEKTRFLAAASHDLRQPLQAIALFGATLEKALQNSRHSENAVRLMQSIHALSTSLDTLLDLSRLDAGGVRPQWEAVELDALFVTLSHTFCAPADQRSLQLRLRASGLWVRSDRRLLHRLLSNLIDNALKYTAEGGILVAARRRADAVWIDVCDTGIGIAPEELDRVFEEFYQAGNAGPDRSRGLGIGLSIVKRLSHLLDHPVHVRSHPNRGTRFRIVLPVAPASPAAPASR